MRKKVGKELDCEVLGVSGWLFSWGQERDRGRGGDIRNTGKLLLQIMCSSAHPRDADPAPSLHAQAHMAMHARMLTPLLSQNLCHGLLF